MTSDERAEFGIEPLAAHHDRRSFDSGVDVLNRYLGERAGQDVRRYLSAVFVATEEGSNVVVGYYTLSAFSIHSDELPPEIARKLPKGLPIPTTLIGRLAVDRSKQGSGIGRILLVDACRRSFQQARTIGSMAVVVDAKDARAETFYRKHGFIPFPERPRRLFLPMTTVQTL